MAKRGGQTFHAVKVDRKQFRAVQAIARRHAPPLSAQQAVYMLLDVGLAVYDGNGKESPKVTP